MKPGYPLVVVGLGKNIEGPCFSGSIVDILGVCSL